METGLKDIHQLKDEFDNLNSSDNLAYIRFYENNLDSIDRIDIEKDDDHYNAKLRLFSEYGLSLVGGGHYTRGASVLEKVIPMFENAPNQDFNKLKEISYFEHLLWSYGVALWETKRVESSIDVFNRLVDYYPDNDKYRSWLNGLKATKIKKYTKPLWLAIAIWLVCDLTIFERFESIVQFRLSIFGAALLVIVGLLELYIYITKRKKARMHNNVYKK